MPSVVSPPPMNIASGEGSSASAVGARPFTIRSPGTPKASALRPMRAARSLSLSTAMARQVRCARIHSIAMLPAPPPMSQSSSPGDGAREEMVTARTSRLVSCPSSSYTASASPGASPSRVPSGLSKHSTATTLSESPGAASQVSATPERRVSPGAPSCSRTVRVEPPKPLSTNSFATWAGVPASLLSTRSRRRWCKLVVSDASGRPTRLTTSTSSTGQPRRAHASEIEDGCGSTSRLWGPNSSTSARPMPKNIGSPLARTTSPRARWRQTSSATTGRRGEGQATRSTAMASGNRSS